MGRSIQLDSLYYHVFNKSIGGGLVFETDQYKERFCKSLSYYNQKKIPQRFSEYLRSSTPSLPPILEFNDHRILKVIAYCIMPDHYHILAKTMELPLLSGYIKNVEISCTRYYNLTRKRKGPLWQSRFKHVRIQTNAQLLHVSRYIHLNPTTSSLVSRPEEWKYSSYQDYIAPVSVLYKPWNEIAFTSPQQYKNFVQDRQEYQKKLRLIKKHLI